MTSQTKTPTTAKRFSNGDTFRISGSDREKGLTVKLYTSVQVGQEIPAEVTINDLPKSLVIGDAQIRIDSVERVELTDHAGKVIGVAKQIAFAVLSYEPIMPKAGDIVRKPVMPMAEGTDVGPVFAQQVGDQVQVNVRGVTVAATIVGFESREVEIGQGDASFIGWVATCRVD